MPAMLDELTLAIGALLIAVSLASFRRTRRFIAACRTAEGRITGYSTEETDEGVHYYSVIRFRGRSGVEHELRGSSGMREPPVVDEIVPITYDPSYPANAWITGTASPWVIPWLVLLLGVAAMIGGFILRAEG